MSEAENPGAPGAHRPGEEIVAEGGDVAGHGVPVTDRRLMAVAAVLLLIPVVALMWVPSYTRTTPRLGAFPFFFWYQILWVFLCSACTFGAYRVVRAARRTGKQR